MLVLIGPMRTVLVVGLNQVSLRVVCVGCELPGWQAFMHQPQSGDPPVIVNLCVNMPMGRVVLVCHQIGEGRLTSKLVFVVERNASTAFEGN